MCVCVCVLQLMLALSVSLRHYGTGRFSILEYSKFINLFGTHYFRATVRLSHKTASKKWSYYALAKTV